MADEQNTSHKRHRGMRSFWWHGFKGALAKSWDKFGNVLIGFALVYVMAVIVLAQCKPISDWLKKQHPDFDMSNWLQLYIPTIVGGVFLLYHVFRAPYEIYRESWHKHQNELERLTDQMRQNESRIAQLEATMAHLVISVRPTISQYNDKYIWIIVRNDGPAFAKEVEVRLERIDFKFDTGFNKSIRSRIGRRGIEKDTPENAVCDINANSDDTWVLMKYRAPGYVGMTMFVIPEQDFSEDGKKLREFNFWVSANAKNAKEKKEVHIKLTVDEDGRETFKCEEWKKPDLPLDSHE